MRGVGGFTFVELIVGIAIVLMLAAVVTPTVTASLDRTRREQGVGILSRLANSVVLFRSAVGRYPGRLSQLNNQITTSDTNSCGSTFNPAQVSGWSEPFYNERVLTPGGPYPVYIGNAEDQLVRISLGGNNALLGVVVNDVRTEDALILDRDYDGSDGSTAGSIRWGTANASGQVTMQFLMPISGC